MATRVCSEIEVALKCYFETARCVSGCMDIGPDVCMCGVRVWDPERPVGGEEGRVEDWQVNGARHIGKNLRSGRSCALGSSAVELRATVDIFAMFLWDSYRRLSDCCILIHCPG